MAKIELTFRNELRNKSEDTNIVYREFEHLIAQLNALFEEAGQNFTTQNLTVTNIINNNGDNITGNLFRATRTFSHTQIVNSLSNGTPLELFLPDGLSMAPGVGFAANPVRCDWSLDTSDGRYNNVASDCYAMVTLGASANPFDQRFVAAQLIPELGLQGTFTGMFEPSSFSEPSSVYENQSFYFFLANGLGALTDGDQDNTLIVNVYYVKTPVTTSTATNTIVYTTSGRKVEPAAATRITVTPVSTAFAASNWYEIIASTPADWAICGIAFNPGADVGFFAFEIGVGAAASEVVVGAISGVIYTEATILNHRMVWPVPIGGRIPAGSRVSARIYKQGTSTANWTVAIEYFDEPVTGNPVISPVAPTYVIDDQAITPSATDGAWSLWVPAATSPALEDGVIGMMQVSPAAHSSVIHYEVELGRGSSGSEISIQRARAISKDTSTLGEGGPYQYVFYGTMPVRRKGQGIFHRVRKTGTSTTAMGNQCIVYPNVAFPLLTTEQPTYWYPDTGNSLVAMNVNGAAWVDGTYTVLFTASNDLALTHVIVNNATTGGEVEVDIATGTPGNEVVVARTRCSFAAVFNGDIQPIPLVIARNIPDGSIISARVRTSSALTVALGIGYVENPDFYQRLDVVGVCYPSAANAINVAGANSAWADSAWGELTAATATEVYLTRINFNTSINSIDMEIQLGTGTAGNEVGIDVFTTYVGDTSGGEFGHIPIFPPIRVAANKRLVFRVRKTGTSTANISCSVVALPTA